MLHQVGLDGRGQDKVGTLSGGMRRRLGISQALLGRPSWIVLDEPTNALDPAQRHALLECLRAMAGEVGIVMSTHLVEDAAALADDIVILSHGTVVWHGKMTEVGAGASKGPAALEALFLDVTQAGARDVVGPA